jgi:hypothetical protein
VYLFWLLVSLFPRKVKVGPPPPSGLCSNKNIHERMYLNIIMKKYPYCFYYHVWHWILWHNIMIEYCNEIPQTVWVKTRNLLSGSSEGSWVARDCLTVFVLCCHMNFSCSVCVCVYVCVCVCVRERERERERESETER